MSDYGRKTQQGYFYRLWCFVLELCLVFSEFLFAAECKSKAKLHGKTVIITGGNTGIGKQTALDLAQRGAKVIIACRDIDKGKKAAEYIVEKVQDANVIVRSLDLASFSSIKQFAEKVLRDEPFIHILINNAGVMACAKSKTVEGFETHFGVNYLGHFMLTNLLLDRIIASAPARIVNVSSAAYAFGEIKFDDINLDHGYNRLWAYSNSKLANILFTRELAKKLEGAKIIIACRDVQKGHETTKDISEKVQNSNVVVKRLDLASFASIKSFAQDILENEPYIHILISNAGVAACPKSLTEDGYEMQFGVNHLGHFLLTHLLLDRIKSSAPARIINVASISHIYGNLDFNDINLNSNYRPIPAYCRSKLANILFTRELAKRLEGTGVTTYSLHPGAIHTGLGQHLGSSTTKFIGRLYEVCSRIFFKSPIKGAQTTIYCAVEEKLAKESGFYYCDCTVINPSSKAQDDSMARQLWDVSEYLIAKAL